MAEPAPGEGADNCIAALALPVEPVAAETLCSSVYQRFRDDPDLMAVPVLQQDRPIGLVNRHDLTMSLAHDFGRALYANKPITARMDAQALIVESSLEIDALEWMLATNRPAALTRGFIVVTDGRYLGVGTALSLLKLGIARREERSRQTEDARHAAEQANRAKSRFLAVMSHELRTPLNAVIGFSDVMLKEVFGPIAPVKYAEYLQYIHSSAEHLLDLINEVLDTARVESGKMELFEEPIDIAEHTEAAIRIVSERARIAGIHLVNDVPPAFPPLLADRRALKQILLNLLSNAVKFAPGGEIVVRAREEPDGAARVEVSDTGIGMSEAEVAIALTPFGQVANEHTRNHHGSGLGLPLVKNLVELHGGRLDIASRRGHGTTVAIVLPPTRVQRTGSAPEPDFALDTAAE